MHSSCHVLANPDKYTDEDRRRAKRTERRRELRAGAKPNKEINSPRPTRCVETGQIFPSRKSAGDWLGVDGYRISSSVYKHERCLGYHFADA